MKRKAAGCKRLSQEIKLMKSIALGKEMFGLPEKAERVATHFIR